MRLPVNTVIHTTIVGLEPATFRSLVDCWSDALPVVPPSQPCPLGWYHSRSTFYKPLHEHNTKVMQIKWCCGGRKEQATNKSKVIRGLMLGSHCRSDYGFNWTWIVCCEVDSCCIVLRRFFDAASYCLRNNPSSSARVAPFVSPCTQTITTLRSLQTSAIRQYINLIITVLIIIIITIFGHLARQQEALKQ